MAKADRTKQPQRRKQPIATFSEEKFDQAVESHPRAKRALALMMDHGSSGQKILSLLRAYVEQERMPKGFAAVERQTGLNRKKLDTMASTYERVASEVEMLIGYRPRKSDDPEEQRRFDEMFPPALHHLAAQSPLKSVTTSAGQVVSIADADALVPEVLRNLSVVLRSSWPREWVRSGRFDTHYGMNLCLFCAVSLARKAIGRPCFADLAALIEAFHMTMGTSKTVEPGTVQKVEAGFKRRYPEEAAQHEEAPWMHE